MLTWADEELLKKYAPALLGNDFGLQSDLYNANADAGVYPEVNLDAPMRQAGTKSPYDSLNSIVDLDAVTKQMEAERQPDAVSTTAQSEEKKPSMWSKVGNFLKEALPVALMVSGAGFAPKLAIGAAMANYNNAKQAQAQNEFENQLERDKYKLLTDQFGETKSQNEWERLDADRTQAWNERKDFLDRQDTKEERAERARQWQANFDQTAAQNDVANEHWRKTYELEKDKFDADTLLQQGKIDVDEWYKRKQIEVEQQELNLKRELGLGELGVKRAVLEDSKNNPSIKGNTAASHFNQIAAMKTRYKSAADYLADLKKYQEKIIAKIGLKNYQTLFKDGEDWEVELEGKPNPQFRSRKDGKKVQSPIRSYIQYMVNNKAW
jgi:hypothetical protein